MMSQKYDFDVELEAIRTRIDQEHSLEVQYINPNYQSLRPLVIFMTREMSALYPDLPEERRREIRLNMLSLWTASNVRTTYDLTVYQCSTILRFFQRDESGGLTERARRFFIDSAKMFEEPSDQRENKTSSSRKGTLTMS